MTKRDPIERFLEKFDIGETPEGFDSPCYNWIGAYGQYGYKLKAEYGFFYDGNKRPGSHRYAYETFVGPIPEKYDLDHLCLNKRCCNPDHLEPVTRLENLIRGGQMETIINISKNRGPYKFCRKGHLFSGNNVYISNGERRCKTCRLEWERTRKSL